MDEQSCIDIFSAGHSTPSFLGLIVHFSGRQMPKQWRCKLDSLYFRNSDLMLSSLSIVLSLSNRRCRCCRRCRIILFRATKSVAALRATTEKKSFGMVPRD